VEHTLASGFVDLISGVTLLQIVEKCFLNLSKCDLLSQKGRFNIKLIIQTYSY